MSFKIPQSVKIEHQTLHAELAEATKVGGKIGEAAKAVAQLLYPHLEKEEAYVLPLLGLLPNLAAGQLAPQMETILPRPERLKIELPQMLEEHEVIAAALTNFIEAAKQAEKPEYVRVKDSCCTQWKRKFYIRGGLD
jgi:hypothetical protein